MKTSFSVSAFDRAKSLTSKKSLKKIIMQIKKEKKNKAKIQKKPCILYKKGSNNFPKSSKCSFSSFFLFLFQSF